MGRRIQCAKCGKQLSIEEVEKGRCFACSSSSEAKQVPSPIYGSKGSYPVDHRERLDEFSEHFQRLGKKADNGAKGFRTALSLLLIVAVVIVAGFLILSNLVHPVSGLTQFWGAGASPLPGGRVSPPLQYIWGGGTLPQAPHLEGKALLNLPHESA